MRAANAYIDQHPESLAEATPVEGNPPKTRTESKFFELFAPHHEIPTFIPGFELSVEDRDVMTELFPAGAEAARQMLHAFIHTKARKTQMAAPPLNPGAKAGDSTGMNGSSRLGKYHHERDLADRDSSSRLSPYLAAGVISARELVREATKATNSKMMVIGKDSGVGVWVQEIGKFQIRCRLDLGLLIIGTNRMEGFLHPYPRRVSERLDGSTFPRKVSRREMGEQRGCFRSMERGKDRIPDRRCCKWANSGVAHLMNWVPIGNEAA